MIVDQTSHKQYVQELEAYENKRRNKKMIDKYLTMVKHDLGEINDSYDLGVDVLKCFQANLYHIEYNTQGQNIGLKEKLETAYQQTHDTLEGKLQFVYNNKVKYP